MLVEHLIRLEKNRPRYGYRISQNFAYYSASGLKQALFFYLVKICASSPNFPPVKKLCASNPNFQISLRFSVLPVLTHTQTLHH